MFTELISWLLCVISVIGCYLQVCAVAEIECIEGLWRFAELWCVFVVMKW